MQYPDPAGLQSVDRDRAFAGYTLFSPYMELHTRLHNMNGDLVHSWERTTVPGAHAYLLENGNLLAAGKTGAGPNINALGGIIEEFDWDGNVVWSYVDDCQHHDFQRLANGNTIYVGVETMPQDLADRVAGGKAAPDYDGVLLSDYLREVNSAGEAVWEWHANEHLTPEDYPVCAVCPRHEWNHINTVTETRDGDIMFSARNTHHIAVIDKSTKKVKWEICDWKLGHQHDFQQLDNGNYLVFANGEHGPFLGPVAGSRVYEIDPATKEFVWEFVGDPPVTFYSNFISGCQRLPNGNTLICAGSYGNIFEVTTDGDIVWNYISPYYRPADSAPPYQNLNMVFRAYRYAADSPQIAGRLGDDAWAG